MRLSIDENMPMLYLGVMSEAMKQFSLWLPSEMVYSARKTGYDEKIRRAGLSVEDPTSTYGFLGQEWHCLQNAHMKGVDYLAFHGKSTQLQLAKLAAGYYDKFALANWKRSCRPGSVEVYSDVAEITGKVIADIAPWKSAETVDIGLDFKDTPFAEGTIELMGYICSLNTDTHNYEASRLLSDTAARLGNIAAKTYEKFAQEFLSEQQLVLPSSELAQ